MTEKIFIIPGNPCCKYFYNQWAKEIKEHSPQSEVACHIFPIFGEHLSSNEYINKVVSYYESKLNKYYDGDPIHVIAHSIGGYLALRLLERCQSKILKVSLIFPFLGRPEKSGARVLKGAYYLNKMKPLARLIIDKKNFLTPLVSEARFVTKEELRNSLAFAKSEYLYFQDNQIDYGHLDQYRKKIHFYYNNRDIWCSSHTTSSLKNVVSSTYVNADHEFIIHEDQRKEVLKSLSQSN